MSPWFCLEYAVSLEGRIFEAELIISGLGSAICSGGETLIIVALKKFLLLYELQSGLWGISGSTIS